MHYVLHYARVGTLKMEPAWEWIIERVEHPTTVYRLDQLLAAKQKKDPQVAQVNDYYGLQKKKINNPNMLNLGLADCWTERFS